jgi:hypothetical protein
MSDAWRCHDDIREKIEVVLLTQNNLNSFLKGHNLVRLNFHNLKPCICNSAQTEFMDQISFLHLRLKIIN